MMKKEMPVYLFTGFLESGKTSFIQESLESDEFNSKDQTTLLLCCEEGEVEYEPEKFAEGKVYIEVIEEESDFNMLHLGRLENKYHPDRIVVEWNGMWLLDTMYGNMPPHWITYQEMFFAYSPTFLTYNQNMRNLVFDKLKSAEMVVFNRFSKLYDKMAFHKVVRTANRNSQIMYEYERDNVEFDDIEDPLPFDINADIVEVKDLDYAYWYRDINEEPLKWDGKTVKVKGRTLVGGGLPKNSMVLGRHVMTCCVEDIQFAGLVAVWDPEKIKQVVHGDWAIVQFTVKHEMHEAYGEDGPVLHIETFEPCPGLEDDVATF
ncbi:MAG: hypothetical protein MJ146_00740 [Clostridia bacterium]|nr:hypothetical protein [Clostridia bacterium]